MNKRLYFIRHGQTEWNAIGRMQGQQEDSDLSELGREQAAANGRFLATQGLEQIYCSPLRRTRQTLELINGELQLPVSFDDRLMEWDCGDWSGWLRTEVEVKWAAEWAAWRADRFHYRGPNCENYPDMLTRARPFLADVLAGPGQTIGVISHGVIGKVMVAALAGLDEGATLAIHQDNDQIIAVDIQDCQATLVQHWTRGDGPFDGPPTQGEQKAV